ncbi:MAG: metallophosphoesterase [Deltaproteobacteria bacterium]|nr:metallophosphoesterase [Deltaproteobacteria bacterium]
MKLLAISDLHIGHSANRRELDALPNSPDDWLIVAGDVGESRAHLQYTLDALCRRFRQLIWVPGNHELWKWRDDRDLKGEAKYHVLVETCRSYGVITPEDPYVLWQGEGGTHLLAPLFLLYDYSFRPSDVPLSAAVKWAADSGVVCVDEELLLPEPYASRSAWCDARCDLTEQRLESAIRANDCPSILINHFPLMQRLASLPLIPRFSIWCGTRRTEQWHRRFRARVVVSGHLHIRRTEWIDDVRFEEVSFGYPLRQWDERIGLRGYLRQILPEPTDFRYAR